MKKIILAATASFALTASAMAATPPNSILNAKPAKTQQAGTAAVELAAGPGRIGRPSPPSGNKGYAF